MTPDLLQHEARIELFKGIRARRDARQPFSSTLPEFPAWQKMLRQDSESLHQVSHKLSRIVTEPALNTQVTEARQTPGRQGTLSQHSAFPKVGSGARHVVKEDEMEFRDKVVKVLQAPARQPLGLKGSSEEAPK